MRQSWIEWWVGLYRIVSMAVLQFPPLKIQTILLLLYRHGGCFYSESGCRIARCTGLGVFFVSFLILVDTPRLVFLEDLPLKSERACGYRVFCDKVRV